jgi:beta-lactamase superfamily II metal-dependent hydrolase
VGGVVLTHGDAQAIGGFPMVWKEFEPETVFTSSVKMRSPGYRRAIAELEKSDRWKAIAAGDNVDGWTVLNPPRAVRGLPRADDNAVVLRKRIARWSILHLSDLAAAGQQRLLASVPDLRADIVIAGMPEQGEPLRDDLLSAIQAKIIILGTAEYPWTARGSVNLRERLERSGVRVFYVNEEKAVSVSVRADECVIRSMEGTLVRLKLDP